MNVLLSAELREWKGIYYLGPRLRGAESRWSKNPPARHHPCNPNGRVPARPTLWAHAGVICQPTTDCRGSRGSSRLPKGLDPRTPGPRPEPKANAQPSEPPRHPWLLFLNELSHPYTKSISARHNSTQPPRKKARLPPLTIYT